MPSAYRRHLFSEMGCAVGDRLIADTPLYFADSNTIQPIIMQLNALTLMRDIT